MATRSGTAIAQGILRDAFFIGEDMELSTAQISFMAASYAVNLAHASGGPVSIQWAGGELKAMPGQKVPDILKAFDKGQVTQPPVDSIQLDQVRGVNSPQPKVWLTRPDPGYQGETKMIDGFQYDWEGK